MSEPGASNLVHEVTDAIKGHTDAVQGLSASLLADQKAARAEQDRRFNKQAKKLHRLTAGLIAALVLLALLLLQGKLDADQRADRSRISEQQRACSQEIQNATLARLSKLATSARYRTDEHGELLLDPQGKPIPLDPDEAARKFVELHRGVAQANQALLDSNVICITDHPDPTPLDGDRTK